MPRYFRIEEFACQCGCGLNAIDPWLVKDLDEIRAECGFALIINSGCRCEAHNKAVGGVKGSAHTVQADGLTKAADIRILDSVRRYHFLRHAIKRFKRIVIYDSFIHVDRDESKPQEVVVLKTGG